MANAPTLSDADKGATSQPASVEHWGWDYGEDLPGEIARVVALIEANCFDRAIPEVCALPASLPRLPWIMGQLVIALAKVERYRDASALAATMVARCPLCPEVVRTLSVLASMVQSRFRQVFYVLGQTLVHTFGFSGSAMIEWTQRLAYRFRRHGNLQASDYILRVWSRLAWNTAVPTAPLAGDRTGVHVAPIWAA